jgi:hypothetical protein
MGDKGEATLGAWEARARGTWHSSHGRSWAMVACYCEVGERLHSRSSWVGCVSWTGRDVGPMAGLHDRK